MGKRTRTIALTMISVLLISFLVGCSSSAHKKEIIGKWTVNGLEFKDDSDDMFAGLQKMVLGMVFQPGNTIEFINKEKVSIMMNSVNYKWIEKDKLQIGDDEGDDAPILFDVVIDKDTMTLENPVMTVHLNK